MKNYVTPDVIVYSESDLDMIVVCSNCVSYAPSFGCTSSSIDQCNDGTITTATCESISSNCPSTVYNNSLCPTSERVDCGTSSSQFTCTVGTV